MSSLRLEKGPFVANRTSPTSLGFKPLPWWKRLAFRIVAKHLMEQNSAYQCAGRMNWGLGAYNPTTQRFESADIQVPAVCMAHWILREAGYAVCQVDVIQWHEGRALDHELDKKYFRP